MIGLVGYSGTVGTTILESLQGQEVDLYDHKNIDDIIGKEFDTLILCGISANKWIANQNNEEDLKGINNLLDHLKTVKSNKSVMISTIDVHNNDNYGRNRLYAEGEVLNMPNLHCKILRLPGLVGKNIKKNLIYDIAHPDKDLSFTSINSSFIFYNLDEIGKAISKLLDSTDVIVEIGGEPVSVELICDYLGLDKSKLNNKPGTNYISNYPGLTVEQQLELIKNYVEMFSIDHRGE